MSARTSEDLDDLRSLLGSPVLFPLATGVRVAIGPTRDAGDGAAPFLVPEPGALILSRTTLGSRTAGVHLRHGLELAWLLGLPGLARPVAGLLAARTAALFMRLEPPPVRAAAEQDPALRPLAPLAGACPDPARLAALWERLSRYQPAPSIAMDPRMPGRLAEYWPLAGPVEHLLLTGGDTRLQLDPQSGLNRYGCAPRPREGVVGFASCTASTLSEGGYQAAEDCRRRVLAAAAARSPAAALADEAADIRAAILRHYGVADLAEAILSPSGTDATLLLMGLLAADAPGQRITSILVSPSETGSGIPAVARGQHFAERTAAGAMVARGSPVAGFPPGMALATVALRAEDGSPLPAAAVDAACAMAVAGATRAGRAVLHMVDGSKTGLSAPGLAAAAALAERHAGALDVVVDACQARLDAARLHRYLRLGWPVLLTGSKFFGGPPFSGVILFPRARLDRVLRSATLPSGLAEYLGSGPNRLLGLGDNLGLALRWAAALSEIRAFAAVPAEPFAALLHRLGTAIGVLLQGESRFRLVPGSGSAGESWSDRQSIFTFMLRDPADPRHWLSPAALGSIYGWMNADLADRLPAGASRGLARQVHHVGQPVLVGGSPAGPIGALRIALGARLALAAAEAIRPDAAFATAMNELGACVAKLSLVLDRLPELREAAA